MPKIDVSFKQTSKDMRLYTRVMSEEERSHYIKKAIEFYIKHLEGDGCHANTQ